MKFYGTMICPMTVKADKVLRKNGVDVEYIDITANTKNMKEFLKVRDNNEEFDQVKENGKIGIPVFVSEDGKIEFDVYNLEGVTEKVEEESDDDFQGCSF